MRMKMMIWIFALFFLPSYLWAKIDLSDLNNPLGPPRPFTGSLTILINQFFIDDERLGNVHNPKQDGVEHGWGNLHFDAIFGLAEFKYGIEPLLGIGFMKGSSLVSAGGGDFTKYRYGGVNGSVGVRCKPVDQTQFFLQPYVQVLGRYDYLLVKHYPPADPSSENGGSFGGEVSGGLIFSFFKDASRRHVMQSEWELKDFGVITSTRFIKSGWLTKSAYGIDVSGWDFGLGLFMDW